MREKTKMDITRPPLADILVKTVLSSGEQVLTDLTTGERKSYQHTVTLKSGFTPYLDMVAPVCPLSNEPIT